MTRAVVFDLDGTLIDSAPDIHAAANRLMARHGFAPFPEAEIRSFIGKGVGHLVACCLHARGGPHDAARQAQLVDEFLAEYESAVSLTEIYAGVPAALSRLACDGILLGLCTNKPQRASRVVLAHLGLSSYFPVVVGGDSLPERKPHPAPLRATIDALGAARAVFVGDSEIDAETAERAGVPFALHTEGYRKSPVAEIAHGGTFCTFAELPAVVARLLA